MDIFSYQQNLNQMMAQQNAMFNSMQRGFYGNPGYQGASVGSYGGVNSRGSFG